MRRLFSEIGLRRRHVAVVAGLFFIWLLLVVASGGGWNPFALSWDFGNPGAFGDSFGPLNTLMATIAALGALAAYRSQSDELATSRARQEEQDAITQSDRARLVSREYEADRRAEKASFEQTFFNLVNAWRSVLTAIDIDKAGNSVSAHDAFAAIVNRLDYAYSMSGADMGAAWSGISGKYRNDLNHYFRFLYHVIKYVDDSGVDNKYFYVRLVRALLSEAELVLLALNCEYGAGREKFKTLVERYALLHNLSDASRSQYGFADFYGASAFELQHDDTDGASSNGEA